MTGSEQQTSKRLSVVRNLWIPIVAIAVCVIVCETGLRFYRRVRYAIPVLSSTNLEAGLRLDSVLGWVACENYQITREHRTPAGRTYTVRLTQDNGGFRLAANNSRPILVIGDSYTQAVDVSDNETYYRVLGLSLKRAVSAHGTAGFGTLQEYLLLRRLLRHMQPSLIILQVCTNDLIDNSLELESLSISNNHFTVRPYWSEEGHVSYALPVQSELGRRIPLQFQYSALYRWLAGYCRIIRAKSITNVGDAIVRGEHRAMLDRSSATTARLISSIKSLSVPLVLFLVNDIEPYSSCWRRIAADLDLPLIEAPQPPSNTQNWWSDFPGGHWTPEAHAIVGQYLASKLPTVGNDFR